MAVREWEEPFPTSNIDGALSNKLTRIHREVATRLEQIRGVELNEGLSREMDGERRELLAIYVTLSLYELRK